MATLTIRLSEHKAARLRDLARHRGVSVNKLFEEFSTISLAEFDAENRFRALAASSSSEEGLRLLDRLDTAFSKKPDSGIAP